MAGAATDVFGVEPAGVEDSVLVRKGREWEVESREEGGGGSGSGGGSGGGGGREGEMNGRLILSPHLAWWARSSLERLRGVTARNIEAWVAGREGEVSFVS